jgi:hypothetical protein
VRLAGGQVEEARYGDGENVCLETARITTLKGTYPLPKVKITNPNASLITIPQTKISISPLMGKRSPLRAIGRPNSERYRENGLGKGFIRRGDGHNARNGLLQLQSKQRSDEQYLQQASYAFEPG